MKFFSNGLSLNSIASILVFSAEMAAKVAPGPVAATQFQTEAHFTD